MNLPNKLTCLRVLLIPVFLIFLYIGAIPYHFLLALVVFAAASITDALDGKIARARGLVTNFGKFLDPLAVIELDEMQISAIPVMIIVAREFMVSGLRMLTASEGVVVAAGIWGKLKTAFTMVTIVAILIYCSLTGDFNCAISEAVKTWGLNGLLWISTALTIISGCGYLKGYWSYINTDK